MPGRCAQYDELSANVRNAMTEIVRLTTLQLEAFQKGDWAEMMRADKELENAVGRKERGIGAIQEHKQTHGCQP
jgi:hypothetical protein